jgi:8-oxo-dGTP pyrophosphatase MutT (NUDIX family)
MNSILRDLLAQLEDYSEVYPEDAEVCKKFLELIHTQTNCLMRDALPGHLTASAWVLDHSSYNRFLLVRHAKLNLWLQPGGHADGNGRLAEVARQELYEETGVVPLQQREGIFDLSVHIIPETQNMPQHLHYDVRYLFLADSLSPLQISAESLDLGWFEMQQLAELGCDESVLKMARRSLQNF